MAKLEFNPEGGLEVTNSLLAEILKDLVRLRFDVQEFRAKTEMAINYCELLCLHVGVAPEEMTALQRHLAENLHDVSRRTDARLTELSFERLDED